MNVWLIGWHLVHDNEMGHVVQARNHTKIYRKLGGKYYLNKKHIMQHFKIPFVFILTLFNFNLANMHSVVMINDFHRLTQPYNMCTIMWLVQETIGIIAYTHCQWKGIIICYYYGHYNPLKSLRSIRLQLCQLGIHAHMT